MRSPLPLLPVPLLWSIAKPFTVEINRTLLTLYVCESFDLLTYLISEISIPVSALSCAPSPTALFSSHAAPVCLQFFLKYALIWNLTKILACFNPANYGCTDGQLHPVSSCNGQVYDRNSVSCFYRRHSSLLLTSQLVRLCLKPSVPCDAPQPLWRGLLQPQSVHMQEWKAAAGLKARV